jgi:hypothetical protein
LIQIMRRQFAASSRGTIRQIGPKAKRAAMPLDRGKSSMLTERVTYGLGGLLLVNLVLLAVQLALGVDSLPI